MSTASAPHFASAPLCMHPRIALPTSSTLTHSNPSRSRTSSSFRVDSDSSLLPCCSSASETAHTPPAALSSLATTCQARQTMSCWKMIRFWMLPPHGGIFETSSVTRSRLLTIQLELCGVIDTRALCVIVLVTTVYETVKQSQVVRRCQVNQQNGNNGYRMATAAATQQSVL